MDKKAQNYLREIKNMEEQMQAEIKGEPNISPFIPTAGVFGTFRREIPKRTYIFNSKDAFGVKKGFLPSGVTCILAAPGGCGKTYLLIQAAIAAACGGTWLHATAEKPVKVLFLAAEEEQDELDRRAQAVALSMGLYEPQNKKQLELAENNLRIFGRLGNNERLIDDEGKPREIFHQLKFFLEENPDIKLVILDPATDYMSREAEKDSAAAKDWTILLSQLTLTEGRPSILIAHHTRKDSDDDKIFKTSEKDKEPELSADSIRGAGSLVNSFRWAVRLGRRQYDDGSEIVFLRLVKTNYTDKGSVLQFEADKDNAGILRFKNNFSCNNISTNFESTSQENTETERHNKTIKEDLHDEFFLDTIED